MSIADSVRNFIVDEAQWDGPREQLSDDYPLLEKGLIDSLGVFHLVTFLEGEFGVEVQDEELVPENFGTIANIARLVASKRP